MRLRFSSEFYFGLRMKDFHKVDLLTVHLGKYRQFSIRWYSDTNYGYRALCKPWFITKGLAPRFSYDFWHFGFIFENYRWET